MPGPLRVSLDDVLSARTAIGDRLHHTPMFTSATLARRTGAHVYLKAELFQRTGSFKPRGVLTKLASLGAGEKREGVIGISAGNHAQALAWAAATEGADALVVMWEGASEQKIAAARAYGATVDTEAAGPGEAFDRLAELTEQTGRTLVHPFDDPGVIAGQGTVGLELLDDLPELDTILVPVGGGGLVSGVAVAVKELRPRCRIVAVEPKASPALHRALEAGRQVRVAPTSIADGLGAPFAGELPIAICRELLDDSVLVEEDEIVDGMRFLYERAKLACEPAAAAGVAALLGEKYVPKAGEAVAIVVSGGNVAAERAVAILSRR